MKPSNTNTQQIEREIESQGDQPADQPTTSAEQAADLAALMNAAAPATEAGAQVQQQQQEPAGPSVAALQVAELAVGILLPVIAYAVPSLRAAPAELWEPIPAGVAGILDHYGVGMDELQSPWARLALSCAPLLAFAAVEAMKAPPKAPEQPAGDVLDLTAPRPAERGAQVAEVGQKTVTFGAAVPA